MKALRKPGCGNPDGELQETVPYNSCEAIYLHAMLGVDLMLALPM